ncbi:TMEM165/GDT1 family protein [Aquipuribacter sp. MA13-13]|uniref:TMEM165/GDT1 family protein n=1 Tax=Aquipuribacter sp. MA13-13 TaxID=3440840 RepID=UPI003EEBCED9
MFGLPPFDLAVALSAFVPLLLLELPDKTFIATLVLSSRFRPLAAWVGVGLAFGVQTAIAVTAGGLLSRLPEALVAGAAAVLFAAGAVVLYRDSRSGAALDTDGGTATDERRTPFLRAAGTSFVVLFIAEWGDLSQLFTAGLAARSADPVSILVGAWAALLLVAGLAATIGASLASRLPLRAVRLTGAGVCVVLAVLAGLQAVGVPVPL